jgi:hypothetical protein
MIERSRSPLLAALFLLIPLLLNQGCGVVTDMVRDNELNIAWFNNPDFKAPARLKIGILPFDDQINLGPEAGPNLAKLMTEEFTKNSHVQMVSADDLRTYAQSRGLTYPITPQQAKEICRDLDLNIVMEGAIAYLGQAERREGWRKLARWVTDRQMYVEAILSMRAYDGITGTVVTSRSAEAKVHVGDAPDPTIDGEREPWTPTQELVEETLDEAITLVYYRSLDGLSNLPFKAYVTSASGNSATIAYGDDVDLKRGTKFVMLAPGEDIVNDINVVYQIPGPSQASLKVESVGPDSATLTIESGSVNMGDVIQSWDLD